MISTMDAISGGRMELGIGRAGNAANGSPTGMAFWKEALSIPDQRRVDRLAGYREIGVDRVMALDVATATPDEALDALAEDARNARIDLA